MSDIALIITKVTTPHLWLYMVPLFDDIVTRKSSSNKGKRENQRQNLTLNLHIHLH